MSIRSVTHLYDTYEHATKVVADLEVAGIPSNDISLVGNAPAGIEEPASGGAVGAGIGAAIGGGAGLLAGIGVLAIPGIGPVVAAGWLVATLAGAGAGGAAGGLIGSLVEIGVTEEQATVYADGVRRGGTLVTARVDETRVAQVEAIMTRQYSMDRRGTGLAGQPGRPI